MTNQQLCYKAFNIHNKEHTNTHKNKTKHITQDLTSSGHQIIYSILSEDDVSGGGKEGRRKGSRS
jgi:hypothetical protein